MSCLGSLWFLAFRLKNRLIDTNNVYNKKVKSYLTSVRLSFRFPYPQNQYLYNEANVTAAATGIQDYVWGKQMWWDKRTDVK